MGAVDSLRLRGTRFPNAIAHCISQRKKTCLAAMLYLGQSIEPCDDVLTELLNETGPKWPPARKRNGGISRETLAEIERGAKLL